MEENINNIEDKTNSQLRCPYCNSSQIVPDPNTGKLRCNYCHKEFEGIAVSGLEKNVFNLTGKTISKGATDINKNTSNLVAIKCSNCGAEVVIDTNNIANSKCHWCNSILSITSKIDNGILPDVILPFKINRNEAYEKGKKFIKKRSLFTNKQFRSNFKPENVKGVYFPYFIVDSNRHVNVSGVGKHITRKRSKTDGDATIYIYDVDKYNFEREFDIAISKLTIESNIERLMSSHKQTNNIINSIMPFDTENCVKFESNYLVGYTAENRDINVEEISASVNKHCDEIVMGFIEKDTKYYDYGIFLSQSLNQELGSSWQTAYLPVWIYSYQDKKNVIHYVAVNARTGETMGSVPIKKKLLLVIAIVVEILLFGGLILFMSMNPDAEDSTPFIIFLIAFFGVIVAYTDIEHNYLNYSAKHSYADETKYEVTNLRRADDYVEHEKGLR